MAKPSVPSARLQHVEEPPQSDAAGAPNLADQSTRYFERQVRFREYDDVASCGMTDAELTNVTDGQNSLSGPAAPLAGHVSGASLHPAIMGGSVAPLDVDRSYIDASGASMDGKSSPIEESNEPAERNAVSPTIGPDGALQSARARLNVRGPTFLRAASELLRETVDAEAEKLNQSTSTKLAQSIHEEEDEGDGYDTDCEAEAPPPDPNKYGLRTYELTCQRLGVLPVTTIKRSLGSQEVRVKGRSLHAYETLALCNALLDNSAVSVLILDGNVVGPKGAEYLAMLLSDNDHIHTLSLADNNLESSGAEAIADMLLMNETIKNLNLSGNNFKDGDATVLAKAIMYNNYLRTVNLSHNQFGNKAASFMGSVIAVDKCLRSLDLSWNHIRPPGAEALALGLKNNTTLRNLNLAMNGVSTVGCNALSDALVANTTLLDIDLSYNRIYDEGAKKLARAFGKNTVLKRINLSHNPLTTASAIALLTAIKKNSLSAIDVLDMSTVPLYKDAQPLLDYMDSNRSHFGFLYAGIVSSSTDYHRERDPANALREQDPIMSVMEYIAAKGLRLLEFFQQFDRDGGGSISREEFVKGLKTTQIPLTQAQLDELIHSLDTNGDGQVDYGELIAGEKIYRQKIQKMKRKMKRTKIVP